jgi:hypothetical protein
VTFEAFTEEQWTAIRAVRDDWPDDIDWSEIRGDIEGTGSVYWSMRNSRLEWGPPAKFCKRLDSLLRQSRELQGALKKLPDKLFALGPDPGLNYLNSLDRWLQGLLLAYERLAGPEFSGRSDYYRDWLYQGLLEEWEGPLGGDLSFSRRLDNTPYGPLIDFLTLTVKAILGKAPGPSRMAKIIEQYRKSGDFPL